MELVSVSDHRALGTRDHDLSMTVDDVADCFTEDEFLFAVFEPFELIDVVHVSWVGVHGHHCSISRSNEQILALLIGKFMGERSASEVRILQVLIHLWYDVVDSAILGIILPYDQTAFLANCDEINLKI